MRPWECPPSTSACSMLKAKGNNSPASPPLLTVPSLPGPCSHYNIFFNSRIHYFPEHDSAMYLERPTVCSISKWMSERKNEWMMSLLNGGIHLLTVNSQSQGQYPPSAILLLAEDLAHSNRLKCLIIEWCFWAEEKKCEWEKYKQPLGLS